MKTASRDFRHVLVKLKAIGLLLMTDARLPNVASLVAGEPVKGSWWSHPRAHDIFAALGRLAEHEDVLFTKLISGKVTLVHRELWADLLSVAMAREGWQTHGLSTAAQHLMHAVERKGLALSDDIPWPKRFQSLKVGNAVRDLEARLLIHTEEFHTQSGSHAKMLETWHHWADRIRFKLDSRQPGESKRVFERLLTRLNNEYGAEKRFLWQASR
jgi:hypothetical protein